ncbi:MAG: hypothetical protein U0892_07705 [Pirellulales bacterium]
MTGLPLTSKSSQGLRIAWYGSTSGVFGWAICKLREEIVELGVELDFEDRSIDDICLCDTKNVDRIVVACATRLDYAPTWIDELNRRSVGVPWSVMTDSWWDGARRTGIGSTSQRIWPWYRWWDAWHAWFHPESASVVDQTPELFSSQAHASALFQEQATAARLAVRRSAEAQSGVCVIVSACRQTADALAQSAEAAGMRPRSYCSVADAGRSLANVDVSAFVWDDTCMSELTCGRTSDPDDVVRQRERFAVAQVEELRRCFSDALLIANLSYPRFDHWQRLEQAGCDELIVKPSPALPLRNLLVQRSVA